MTKAKSAVRRKAFLAAFPYTIPIFAGFWFLGLVYGVYMNVSGFSFWYPMLMSLTVFGGSLEFFMVTMLLSTVAPLETLLLALMIQARHVFYGIAMLEKYRNLGWKRFYLYFALCDETFSLNYTLKVPVGIDRGWFYFSVSLLNHLYWFTGSTLGGILGSMINFNTQGLEFVMTALFVVIFLEQWSKEKKHYTAVAGFFASIVSLVAFGPESFLLPTMVIILLLLTLFRKPVEKAGGLTASISEGTVDP
ncbi:MAG TPA: branched-chain amino acid transporter AzlC [Clostridiaceae bacterium]|nr:branched-chain amino acid transporter AzlC [Clostridiaceae bacterium]